MTIPNIVSEEDAPGQNFARDDGMAAFAAAIHLGGNKLGKKSVVDAGVVLLFFAGICSAQQGRISSEMIATELPRDGRRRTQSRLPVLRLCWMTG